ncbi:hypothetical protein OF829_05100 [Sphingomonas sp. LB-2]|uniref:hypothetical protein n=1 Tax=Sphingomonas caeni TaxID=2984949 RepID=UPI0022302695|nr:hypothetical protein [Sphingomonas caeni]MCW3846606.1 hypothetical protein [Sphingomonas caeni]
MSRIIAALGLLLLLSGCWLSAFSDVGCDNLIGTWSAGSERLEVRREGATFIVARRSGGTVRSYGCSCSGGMVADKVRTIEIRSRPDRNSISLNGVTYTRVR